MKNIWSLSMLLISAVLLGCGGGGGSNSDISGGNPSAYVWPTGSAPLTVATSSYENKNAAQLVRTQLEKFDPNVSSVSVTFGDFFQDGQFSAFIVVNQSGTNGKVYFLRWKTATSAWVDDTDRILASTSVPLASPANMPSQLISMVIKNLMFIYLAPPHNSQSLNSCS